MSRASTPSPRAPSPRTLAAALLCAACSAYEPRVLDQPPAELAESPAEVARICVYRPHRVAALVPAVVHDNGRLVGMTRGPSYFCYLAEPGRHTIVTRYGDDIDAELGTDDHATTFVDIAPGERRWLHHDVTGIMRLAVRWEDDPARAEQDVAGCRYVALQRAPVGDEPLPPGTLAPAEP